MNDGMVFAAAGRRIDAPDTDPPRFPLAAVDRTKQRVRELLSARRATALVSSAACGADLIALVEAGSLHVSRRVVLPFDAARFKQTSVVDRPGDWGDVFDEVVQETAFARGLIVIGQSEGEAAYAATNTAILDEAERIARLGGGDALGAMVVWEGRSRGGNDLTEQFRDSAARRGFEILQVLTA